MRTLTAAAIVVAAFIVTAALTAGVFAALGAWVGGSIGLGVVWARTHGRARRTQVPTR